MRLLLYMLGKSAKKNDNVRLLEKTENKPVNDLLQN